MADNHTYKTNYLNKFNSKNIAKIVLAIIFFCSLKQYAGIYQVKRDLISPVIPESLITEITHPLIFTGSVVLVAGIIGLVLFFYKKYKLVMILGLLTVIWLFYIYPYFYFQ